MNTTTVYGSCSGIEEQRSILMLVLYSDRVPVNSLLGRGLRQPPGQSAQDRKTQRCRLGDGDRSRAIWLQAASLHRDDLNAVAHEGVELGKAIAAGAVAEQDPDFRVWAAQRGTKREAGTDAERAERTGIEPTARSLDSRAK